MKLEENLVNVLWQSLARVLLDYLLAANQDRDPSALHLLDGTLDDDDVFAGE